MFNKIFEKNVYTLFINHASTISVPSHVSLVIVSPTCEVSLQSTSYYRDKLTIQILIITSSAQLEIGSEEVLFFFDPHYMFKRFFFKGGGVPNFAIFEYFTYALSWLVDLVKLSLIFPGSGWGPDFENLFWKHFENIFRFLRGGGLTPIDYYNYFAYAFWCLISFD